MTSRFRRGEALARAGSSSSSRTQRTVQRSSTSSCRKLRESVERPARMSLSSRSVHRSTRLCATSRTSSWWTIPRSLRIHSRRAPPNPHISPPKRASQSAKSEAKGTRSWTRRSSASSASTGTSTSSCTLTAQSRRSKKWTHARCPSSSCPSGQLRRA